MSLITRKAVINQTNRQNETQSDMFSSLYKSINNRSAQERLANRLHKGVKRYCLIIGYSRVFHDMDKRGIVPYKNIVLSIKASVHYKLSEITDPSGTIYFLILFLVDIL